MSLNKMGGLGIRCKPTFLRLTVHIGGSDSLTTSTKLKQPRLSMESTVKTPKSLSLPWKTRITLWVLDTGLDLILRKDGTVNRSLLKLGDLRIRPCSKPVKGVKTYDVVVDSTRKLWFRVFVSTQYVAQDLPVIVLFHGGGYIVLSPDSKIHHNFCHKLARELPAIVVSVGYRLAPEHRHPSQHDDGLDVLKFLDAEVNRSKWLPENANISRCFIAGDSAGGHITHHVALRASQFNFQQLKVIGLVEINPFFGGEERTDSEIRLDGTAPSLSLKQTDWFWNAFMPLGEPHNRDHPIINVSGPNAVDISKIDLPPTMVVVAGLDILRDWQIRYHEWLKKSGKEVYLVNYPNMFHCFHLYPELPESDQLILEVKDFIHKVLSKIC
ncbi:putative carboxylesterase [Helianthus annuus]|uniref:Carboxylesterase n=1 Tax=Helianthus annuus TaxID=4232 RepID=A0A251VLQ7_HELAN|nr:probable carboxylesterase 18 [Helianthus annuus]KAF5802756.1 putative carboxylesterase [Helianthus annuus]KAJ0567283.1 putative carboxylesterase [Helianthus annuus]KAJ0573878.1 putative carboxylesterase [Helianthus annuus]KAJ0738214.1 putative carboxylesterase [Helianthus annuus]KAJ0912282.1 putative carboxylesterase [Helianthus annuus]